MAAQFITAALRTRRYIPSVDILSVETASSEALQEILSEVPFGGGGGGHSDRPGILVYCLLGLICFLFVLSLFGVLYGIVQRRAQNREIEPGSGYGQKSLMRKVRLKVN